MGGSNFQGNETKRKASYLCVEVGSTLKYEPPRKQIAKTGKQISNQDIFVGDDGSQEAAAQAQKLQARVREAKQRAIDAKEQQEMQRQQTKQVRSRVDQHFESKPPGTCGTLWAFGPLLPLTHLAAFCSVLGSACFLTVCVLLLSRFRLALCVGQSLICRLGWFYVFALRLFILFLLAVQEKDEQKVKEAKKKAEAAIAKRVAEEMGMGSVGQANGIMLTAQRIKRRVVGGSVSAYCSFGMCRGSFTVNLVRRVLSITVL